MNSAGSRLNSLPKKTCVLETQRHQFHSCCSNSCLCHLIHFLMTLPLNFNGWASSGSQVRQETKVSPWWLHACQNTASVHTATEHAYSATTTAFYNDNIGQMHFNYKIKDVSLSKSWQSFKNSPALVIPEIKFNEMHVCYNSLSSLKNVPI